MMWRISGAAGFLRCAQKHRLDKPADTIRPANRFWQHGGSLQIFFFPFSFCRAPTGCFALSLWSASCQTMYPSSALTCYITAPDSAFCYTVEAYKPGNCTVIAVFLGELFPSPSGVCEICVRKWIRLWAQPHRASFKQVLPFQTSYDATIAATDTLCMPDCK